MTWDPELNTMCRTPVQWEAWFEDRALGVRGFKAPRIVNCFVGPSAAVETGIYQEGMARRLLIIPPFDANGSPITSMSVRDRITLPLPMDEPRLSPLKQADPVFDENGDVHHFEIRA